VLVGGDGLVIPSWLALCWIALGSGFEARTPILRNITTGGDITGGFCPGAGFPSCHKSIYRVSEDNFRGTACVSKWMLKKMGGRSFITQTVA
jgi:hypothetical protein